MPTRSAKADWQGDFKRGGGSVSTETGILDAQYNFSGRFESGSGTNPEELLAATHASCFTMALSVGLSQAGTPPESLATEAHVTVDQVDEFLVRGDVCRNPAQMHPTGVVDGHTAVTQREVL